MSVFSDAGKTLSAAFSATRKVAELAEITAGEEVLTGFVRNTGKIVNIALNNAAEMTSIEAEIEMDRFLKEHQEFMSKSSQPSQ